MTVFHLQYYLEMHTHTLPGTFTIHQYSTYYSMNQCSLLQCVNFSVSITVCVLRIQAVFSHGSKHGVLFQHANEVLMQQSG